MRRSRRIAKPQRIYHAEVKRQQKDFSPPPEIPLKKAALPYKHNPRVECTKIPQTAHITPQSKRKRSHEDSALQASPEPSRKRVQVSLAEIKKRGDQGQVGTASDAQSDRVHFWNEQGTWPSEVEEREMQNFRENYVSGAFARRRSSPSGLKRCGSVVADTASSGDQKPSSDKNVYKDEQVTKELESFGSFMHDHEEGITSESRALCQKLLTASQQLPKDTLFSDDLFDGLCKMVKGQNEATVVRYILPELVPSPKVRALRGVKHLSILNETINASWINATRCCGHRPQPDYSIGIHREAFSPEHLRKLRPLIGTRLNQESQYTATYDTCFPLLTTEVKCGASALDIADRQNALSQTVALRGLVTLFRFVNREQELHRKVLGFSISHDNEAVRIYGHYPFIDGNNTTYHRNVLSTHDILPSLDDEGKRWKTPRFVLNVEDIFAPEHFKLICSAVDMLQVEADPSQRSALSFQMEQLGGPSGLSQQTDDSEIADEPEMGDHPITPEVSTDPVGRKKQRTGDSQL
ncbi:MAG: hypothetical protein Q9202_003617 [Teloschistes flavicans]